MAHALSAVNLLLASLPDTPTQWCVQVSDLSVRNDNASSVIAASKEQIGALREERAAFQEQAQQLGNALADSEARLQALAKRHGELT